MNVKLLTKIRRMTDVDLYAAVYMDPLTGVLNRRAYSEIGQAAPCVVLIDLDSLKFVNDTCGYRTGDRYLQRVAEALRDRFGDRVYRLAGDEFAITGTKLGDLKAGVVSIRQAFPVFSYGAGRCLDTADKALKIEKAARVQSGERADRCQVPPWASKLLGGIRDHDQTESKNTDPARN